MFGSLSYRDLVDAQAEREGVAADKLHDINPAAVSVFDKPAGGFSLRVILPAVALELNTVRMMRRRRRIESAIRTLRGAGADIQLARNSARRAD